MSESPDQEVESSNGENQEAAPPAADSFQPGELGEENTQAKSDVDINIILDVDVDLALEVGRTNMSVRNLLQLNQGSIIELDRAADEPLDVLVNGTLVARGEVVVVNESFGVRLTEIVTPLERIGKLK